MTQDKVDFFLMANSKYFPSSRLFFIKSRLETMDDTKLMILSSVEYRDPTLILILSIFLGYLGIDRFMIGDIGMGVLKLLTAGLCGILVVIDWFLIMDKTKETNFEKFMLVA